MDGVDQQNFDRVFAELKGIRDMIGARDARFDAIDRRLDGIDKRFDGVDKRFEGLEAMTRRIAVTVSRHEETFDRMESRLVKLDQWDNLVGMVEKTVAAAESFQDFKTVSDRSLGEHYDVLTDHELRIHRLERRDKEKPS